MRKKRIFKGIAIGLGIFLLLHVAIIGYAKYRFGHQSREKYSLAKQNAPYDAIVVPGVPFKDGNWSWIMKWRVNWAVRLYNEGITKNIIFSGSDVHTPYVEGKIMAIYADSMGVPADHIFVEDRAEHSTENMYYSYVLGKKQGFERIALATDPFQSWMLEGFIEKHQLPVDLIPIAINMKEVSGLPDVAIDPSSAFVADHIPLNQREDRWERWEGTKGNKIDLKELSE